MSVSCNPVDDYVGHYILAQGNLHAAYRAAAAQNFAEAIRSAWSAEHEARQMALALEAARVEASK